MAIDKIFSFIFTIFLVFFLSAFNAVDTPTSTAQGDDVITLDDGAKFQKSECWFEFSKDNIECGWLDTAPANGSQKSDFKLPVVIFHYEGSDREDDPVVYFAGGPGAGAWLGAELIQSFWQNEWDSKLSKLKRDLVLFDQRGSGLSKPSVQCPQYEDHVTRLLLNSDTPEANSRQYRNATLACQQHLKDSGIPINQLATHHSANDIVDIMTALGYDEWNIQSVSYGTRLGIEVQRRYPEKVRTLLLDSVYPPSAHLFQDWPVLLNTSLSRMFQHCEADNACAASAIEYKERFWSLMDRLKREPLAFDIRSPESRLDHILLNDQILLAVLFHAEYRTDILSYLNDAVFELEKNRTDAIQPFVEDYVSNLFDGSFSDAVYWAVECHDNPMVDLERYANDEARYTKLSPYLLKDNNICEIWNQDYSYIPLNSERQVETPVLIFSGEDDPITPSDWAIDSAAEFDNNAYLFSFYGVSHSVLDNKFCATELYSNFVNNPSQRPRANCRVGDNDINEEVDLEESGVIASDEKEPEEIAEETAEGEEVVAAAAKRSDKRLPN